MSFGRLYILVGYFFVSLSSFVADAAVHQLVAPESGKRNTGRYFDSIGLESIRIVEKCDKKRNCVKNLVSRSKVLMRNVESSKTRVSILATGRYQNRAFALIKVSKEKSRLFLIDDRGNRSSYPHQFPSALAVKLNKRGGLISVSDGGISLDGELLVESYGRFIRASINNTPSGKISITAITENNDVLVCDMTKCISTEMTLSAHGDIDNVSSSYVTANNVHYGVVYHYINNYNKGLKVFKADIRTGSVKKSWLYNSDTVSIGFNPDIYLAGNTLVVGTKNSTERKDIYFPFKRSLTDTMQDIEPEHTIGFEEENNVAFTLGTGLAFQFWNADSSVESGDITLLDVDYEISAALYKSALIEGRIGDTQIGVAYLKNEAEDAGGLIADASEYFSMFVDFNGLLEASRSLRIRTEQATINGVATVTGQTNPLNFSTEYNNYSVLVMAEQGKYRGIQISQYKMPSAVGFSTISGNTNAYYDPDLGMTRVSYIFGYDELSYSKRYETDISRKYLSYSAGFGLGVLDISSNVQSQAETDLGAPLGNSFFVELNLGLEYGYIMQKRLKSLSGFGALFQVGYKASLSHIGSSRSEDSESTDLVLEFDRLDLLHGPFVRGALVF